ncbi:MAG: hypothetical protein J6J03_03985 [Tyzzerella sp.]|nr:hypothetical protein [Tyzzerella sp.]
MKKYVKPQLFYEIFEPSQQIAACDYDSRGSQNDEGCKFTGTNKDFNVEMAIFLSTPTCGVIAESYCYHNASSGMYGIFNS